MSRKVDEDFVSHVVDLLQGLGPVYARRMFGGHGIFLDGLMFGLLADRELYFKVDAVNRESFVELGLQPFTYYKQGKPMALSYFQAPEEALESLEVMSEWGNSAFAAALRAAAKKRPRKKSGKSTRRGTSGRGKPA
ncbi:MAG: TfoX/Sxy family protein [Pseudomonadales bacterium]|nr:TfoX/Sxy family protein [Pseudomonadales bacterium]